MQQVTEVFLRLQVEYSVEVKQEQHTVSCHCHKEETVSLPAIAPFEVSLLLQSLKVGLWQIKPPVFCLSCCFFCCGLSVCSCVSTVNMCA